MNFFKVSIQNEIEAADILISNFNFLSEYKIALIVPEQNDLRNILSEIRKHMTFRYGYNGYYSNAKSLESLFRGRIFDFIFIYDFDSLNYEQQQLIKFNIVHSDPGVMLLDLIKL